EQSIAIEFDSFFNSNWDDSNNQVSVLQDGDIRNALAAANTAYDLNGDNLLTAWIDYDGESDLLEVYLADSLNKPETSLLALNIDLAGVVGEQAFFGFSAATGGRVNNHDILNWELASNSSLIPAANDPTQLESIIDFEDFADVSQLNFNGNAGQANDSLRLTTNKTNRRGSVFFDEPIRVNHGTSFATQFQFQILGGTNGAAGFAFILQNDYKGDDALGSSNSGVGYQGIGQSIAIEFDTNQDVADPNSNHISLLLNGDSNNALVNANAPFDLNSGQALNAWIDYDGVTNQLEVFLSDTATKPQTAILTATVNLTDLVGDRARVGFSAATGDASNIHDILNWSFASSDRLAPEGNFSEMIDWPSVAIHAGLTPDGKVLTYGLDANFRQDGDQRNTKFAIWDPKQGTNASAFNVLNMSHPVDNAFCSGMMLLPDGRMLIAGGAVQGDRDAGNDLVHIYDYRTGQVTMLPEGSDLLAARWYPTMTTLTDGRILLQGGRDANQVNGVFTPEIYTADQGSSWLNGATSSEIYSNERSQWWYPRSWVAPNGQVFGITGDDMYYLDPNSDGSITPAGTFDGSSIGITSTAVMYDQGKILQTGGWGTEASIIDINGETPVISSAGTTNYRRVYGDSTVLPDGTVFVSGGSRRNNEAIGIAYAAEIWDPDTNTWTVVDSAAAPRLYHSTSLLLPDGTVLTAGGTTPGFDSEALSSEIYRPAYLYDDQGNLAERPTLTSEIDAMDWSSSLTATVGEGQNIDRVSLVSFGAVTHSFDMGQRFLELDFTQSGDQLTIETPESANIAPPGYYMLFAIDEQGVPSEAKIVHIAPECLDC
ncbi:MAG: galactose oxidase-like domain-containing protein, partial [Cyanobacteria bacterium J06638_38]